MKIQTLLLLTPLAYCAPAAASLPIGALETSLEKLLVEAEVLNGYPGGKFL
jgi:hypothetical protein